MKPETFDLILNILGALYILLTLLGNALPFDWKFSKILRSISLDLGSFLKSAGKTPGTFPGESGAPADPHIFRVVWSKEDQSYVGTCEELPSLSHLATTPEAALSGIRDLVSGITEEPS